MNDRKKWRGRINRGVPPRVCGVEARSSAARFDPRRAITCGISAIERVAKAAISTEAQAEWRGRSAATHDSNEGPALGWRGRSAATHRSDPSIGKMR